MKIKCLNCGKKFEGTISYDKLGWHSYCEECDTSFDVDIPNGKILMLFASEDTDLDSPTFLQSNRCKGIEIGCYDRDIDKLKYPLKLVSASYKGTYKECDMVSYGDESQGFVKTYW